MRATMMNRLAAMAALLAVGLGAAQPVDAQSAAKDLFSAKAAPAALPSESYGFYSKGCISGAVALPTDGATWQAMRLSRNRRWGHPTMIAYLESLSQEASQRGIWPGLLVGDISQPRGGPMSSGHASHQIGLDADIWFQPMPRQRLSANAREEFPFRSVLRKGTLTVDDRVWTDNYRDLIKLAASDPKVQRVFVHPGVKKKLCETAGRDRGWLHKVRPIYGHDEHFHIRLFCQPGSPGCKPQEPVGKAEGCGDLDWWFNVALKPPKPGAKPGKPRPAMTMAALPKACRVVLNAPDGSEASYAAARSAPLAAPSAAHVVAPAPAAMAITGATTTGFPDLPPNGVPIPGSRPLQ